MRYSNLSNNMMISELWTTIQIQIQTSSQARLCSCQASLWVGGAHDRHNSAPELTEHPPPPPPPPPPPTPPPPPPPPATRSCWILPWLFCTSLNSLLQFWMWLIKRFSFDNRLYSLLHSCPNGLVFMSLFPHGLSTIGLSIINNYSPKARLLSGNIHRDEVEVNIPR
jgi:hypothetical protein